MDRIVRDDYGGNGMRFKVGDTPWWATWDNTETSVECPHCGGTGRIRVTFHDDVEVSIPCENCSRGYEPPTGRVTAWERTTNVRRVTIKGFEFRDGVMKWQTTGSYTIEDTNLFETEDDAKARADALAAEAVAHELEQIGKKAKDERSWAWNASYHRKEIKRCEQSIKHHTAKLSAANLKQRKMK